MGRGKTGVRGQSNEVQMEGIVLTIDRCSTHAGPGVRTVVFLKGCPLRCLWCSTPDSQRLEPQLLHMETLCAQCGRCVSSCPEPALQISGETVEIDRERCKLFGRCLEVCLHNARPVYGTRMTLGGA